MIKTADILRAAAVRYTKTARGIRIIIIMSWLWIIATYNLCVFIPIKMMNWIFPVITGMDTVYRKYALITPC